MTYKEKLLDPRWQKKRLEIFERDGFKCTQCDATDKTLHVHHMQYSANPWEAPSDKLLTLCFECHYSFHSEWDDRSKELLRVLKNDGFFPDDLWQLGTLVQQYPGMLKRHHYLIDFMLMEEKVRIYVGSKYGQWKERVAKKWARKSKKVDLDSLPF